jgi:hypothetical protein
MRYGVQIGGRVRYETQHTIALLEAQAYLETEMLRRREAYERRACLTLLGGMSRLRVRCEHGSVAAPRMPCLIILNCLLLRLLDTRQHGWYNTLNWLIAGW